MAARKNATATGAGQCCAPRSSPGTSGSSARTVRPTWRPGWRTTGRCGGSCPPGTSYLSSTLPHPACTLSVERGHRREGIGDEPVVVTGVITQRFDVTVRDEGWVFAAKFRPGGLAGLAGVHARDLRDVTVPATEVFDRATIDALRELGPAHSTDECRRGLDAVLGRLARRRTTTTCCCSTSSPRCSTTARWCGWRRSRSAAASAPARCSGSSSGTSGSAPSGCSPATGCTTSSPTSTPGTAGRWPTSPRVRLVRPGPLHPRVHRPGRRTPGRVPAGVGHLHPTGPVDEEHALLEARVDALGVGEGAGPGEAELRGRTDRA